LADVIEFLESRSIQTAGGRGAGRRVFHVIGETNVANVWNMLGTAGDNGVRLPRKGEPFPDLPGLRARDFSISLASGHNDVWLIEWDYEVISRGFPNVPDTTIEALPAEVGYVEVSSEIRAEFANVYRYDGSPPLNYPEFAGTPYPDTPPADISGQPVDRAGVPVSTQRNKQELVITENVSIPQWSTYRSFRFYRNASPWYGAPAGTVLYRGASVRRIGVNVWQVSHSFMEDSEFHLEQLPEYRAPDLTPALNEDGTHAYPVYWIQPFPNLAEFGSISGNF